MRVADGAVRDARNGGYLHVLQERNLLPIPSRPPKPEPPPAAPVNRRHIVYQALLDALPLNERHASNLTRRGLSEITINRNGYATLPTRFKNVCNICESLAIFDNPLHVPGFFTDQKGHWQFTSGKPGFLVPVRDVEGRIQAFQVRRDQGEPRYVWFSSPNLPAGASSGAPIHFAQPKNAGTVNEVIVTEGALKADVIAEHLGCVVVGVPGVSSFAVNFGSWLTFKMPALQRVLIAYDSDWKTKPMVRAALARMIESITEAGLAGVVLEWDKAKGLDDLLAEGRA